MTQFYGELCSAGSGWKELARFQSLGILQRADKELNPAAKLEAKATELRDILRQHPDQVDTLFRLAQVLEGQKAWEEAAATYRHLLTVRPEHADAHNFLGILQARRRDFSEAINHFHTFLQLQPQRASGHHNIGVACADQNQTAEAIPHFDAALQLEPEHAEAHKGRAMALLKLGRFAEGWAEYEWRWRCKDLPPLRSSRPLWDGSPLDGQTVMLHSEQGMGDTLQFIRYAPLVKQLGGTVIVACPAALVPLLRTCSGIDRLNSRRNVVPPHDLHIPLLSLPRVLRTELDNVPCNVPYLHADPMRVQFWRNELARLAGFRVGIVWQGNTKHLNDHNRSIPLERFQVLAEAPGVHLVSLQVGKGSEQLQRIADRFQVTDLRRRIEGAYGETAAVIKNLDLVICCDTSVAHLAGALGVPVWVALPFSSDWRWLHDREDSPWYPTMRLFRQQQAGDWPELFARMAQALSLEAEKPRPAPAAIEETYTYSPQPEADVAGPGARYSEPQGPGRLPEEQAVEKKTSPPAAPVPSHIVAVLRLLQAHRLAEAEQALKKILAENDRDADAWFQSLRCNMPRIAPLMRTNPSAGCCRCAPIMPRGKPNSAFCSAGRVSPGGRSLAARGDPFTTQPGQGTQQLGGCSGRNGPQCRGASLLAGCHQNRGQLS